MTYTARCIFPATSPPLERGTITVEGDRIASVDPHGVRTPDVDLGNVAIIPGLVNAHTHLDLSGARGKIPPTDPEHFTDWLMGVIEYRRTRTPEEVQEDIRDGLEECLRAGTTLVGDITVEAASFSLLTNSTLRAVMFWEYVGLSKERQEAASWKLCEWLVEKCREKWQFCGIGNSPHSPYSAGARLIDSFPVAGKAKAIHLAETATEEDLLLTRAGPFVPFLRRLGVFEGADFSASWQTCITNNSFEHQLDFFTRMLPDLSDVEISRCFEKPVIFVHCNYLPISTGFGRNHHIVFCPRTHAAFQHPRHPFAEFLARGVNVALGTDSLASNPDLDLFEEARFVYQHRKDVSPETILQMATINGAKALGFENDCGSLEAGKSADLVVMPLGSEDNSNPHHVLFHAPDAERRTLFRGEWRV